MRLDQYLVEKNLARSRSQAQDWIKSGHVQVSDGFEFKIIKKPAFEVSAQALIKIDEATGEFVSRAGDKLKAALSHLKLLPQELRALDIGISTGGFTDCLLKSGASQVIGVDVGRGQLAEELKSDSRLILFESLNARNLIKENLSPHKCDFDLCVMDVSFISIELILPQIPALLKEGGLLLSLVKPQFELGAEALDKRGIVKDPSLYVNLEKKVRGACTKLGFDVIDYFSSEVPGKDGNQEFFIFARK